MERKFQETLKILSAYSRGELYKLLGPRLVFIEPTNFCNLKCKMCDRWKWNTKGKLTVQKMQKIFKDLKILGTKRVVFTGGEPLLRSDIKELIKGLNEAGIKPTIYTNGYLFNEEIGLCILKNNADVSFSLDGFSSPTHEKIRGVPRSFSPVIKGIRLLSQIRNSLKKTVRTTKIVVNYTIQEENVDDLKLGVYEIDKLGADSVRFALVHSPGRFYVEKESIQKIKEFVGQLVKISHKLKTDISFSPFVLDLAKNRLSSADLRQGLLCAKLLREFPVPCFISHYSMVIDAFGRVFPCLYTHYDTNDFASYEGRRQRFIMGNVFQEDLKDIWNGRKYNKFRKKVKLVTEKTIPEVCTQCEYYHKFKSYYLEFLEAQESLKKMSKRFDFSY